MLIVEDHMVTFGLSGSLIPVRCWNLQLITVEYTQNWCLFM